MPCFWPLITPHSIKKRLNSNFVVHLVTSVTRERSQLSFCRPASRHVEKVFRNRICLYLLTFRHAVVWASDSTFSSHHLCVRMNVTATIRLPLVSIYFVAKSFLRFLWTFCLAASRTFLCYLLKYSSFFSLSVCRHIYTSHICLKGMVQICSTQKQGFLRLSFRN